jgi:hypothetical protein
MKTIILDLNKVSNSSQLDLIISEIVREKPDIVVFTGYKRNMQEKILHPLQKSFISSRSEASGEFLIISRGENNVKQPMTIILKDTGTSVINIEILEGKNLNKSFLPFQRK